MNAALDSILRHIDCDLTLMGFYLAPSPVVRHRSLNTEAILCIEHKGSYDRAPNELGAALYWKPYSENGEALHACEAAIKYIPRKQLFL